MKRIRLLVLAGVIAAAVPFGMSAAGATGGGGSTPSNYVSIKDTAQYEIGGTYIEVGLTVKCQKSALNTLGTVDVVVKQSYPETPYPQGAFGIGGQSVVCDGAPHSVAVTVPLGVFDAGKAWAEATVNPVIGNKATAKRWITIVHV